MMAEFDDYDVMKSRNLLRDNVLGSASMSVLAAANHVLSQQKSKRKGSKVIKRTRKTVDVIFRELGPKNIRKSYRMHKESFWKLHRLLFKSDDTKKRTKQGLPPNGYILNSSRLSMALRWFAGGDKGDIAPHHGVGFDEVMKSVWEVVDLVNKCEKLQFKFPDTHVKQKRIALGFKKKSSANFDTCVGCIDCMLVWTERPSEADKVGSDVGTTKYFCGRKKKYGMVLQAVCDHNLRFLDMDISQPASTSDFLTFCTCSLLKKLQTPGFLFPGLTLFGDGAYVNTSFMTSPFKGVVEGGLKDAFNFYHSSLRITIECAFGVFVHRWGVLRKPLPCNISIPKICALVRCLCVLHNF